ncbi:histidine phosphatase family protein [Comamonas sp. MYb21]|uniref:histidine phosphatase family protein n=1 Tax=Comamonas sp. MYb21 TaxID=1848648 RepID=UPI0030B47E71
MGNTEQGLKLWIVRHGQSTVNAGAVAHPDAPLTALGHAQAQALVERFSSAPDLVITSPLLRARQTAAPLLGHWPRTPAEVWPIEEFCYLSPSRCAGSTVETRRPWVGAYWDRCSPDYADGADAESFADFMARVSAFHQRLMVRGSGFVVVVGHGQFLRAYQLALTHGFAASADAMRRFRQNETTHPLRNAEIVDLGSVLNDRAAE